MKRILILTVVILMGLTLAACGQREDIPGVGPEGAADAANPDKVENGLMTGSMDEPASYEINKEEKVLFDEAVQAYTIAEITPIAYLGSQIVAGTNHCFMCRFLDSIPDAKETYAFISVYEDLNGKAVLRDVRDSHIETNINGQAGGWELPETPDLSEDLKGACTKALEAADRDDCTPLCCLSQQVVSGMNYCIFCKTAPAGPEEKTGYVLAYLYQDLQGNAEITDLIDFQIDQ